MICRSGRSLARKTLQLASWAGLFTVVEQGSQFGFSGTGEDLSHDVAENVDGTIGLIGGIGGLARVGDEEKIPCHSGASLGDR
jgi:hypothetical protein